MSGHHDIFLCHDQASATAAKRLASALAAKGLSCYTHEGDTSAELSHKLAISRAFIAFANEGFFESRGCQTHLSMAWVSAHREGRKHSSRILLINPEPFNRHIYPLSLRDCTIAGAEALQDLPQLASKLHELCLDIKGDLGSLFPLSPQTCQGPFDRVTQAPWIFGGRNREIWDIYQSLHENAGANPGRFPVVAISGDPGHGKTLVALEYAFRFKTAYPGGVYRISARDAEAAPKISQLAVNPSLKPQLLALLRLLTPESDCTETTSLKNIREQLGKSLHSLDGDFLWIVDDLPEGINGPVIQQWLAPTLTNADEFKGHTILISESQRYDHRADPIHLPILSETAGQIVLSRGQLPGRSEEKDSLNWLTDEIGRHPRFAGIAAGYLESQKSDRRSTFGRLAQRISRRNRLSAEIAQQWTRELPEGRERSAANLLLDTLHNLDGAGRDLLRLATELEDHPIPLEIFTQCLLLAGLSRDERTEDLFTIFLNEPEEVPLDEESASQYAIDGAQQIAALGLGLALENSITIPQLVIRAFQKLSSTSPRQTLLGEAALRAIYVVAESAHAAQHFDRFSALTPHARKLVDDLRERAISQEDNSAEITGRIRLALSLADLDLAHGAHEKATGLYRSTSAYLVRAMASDPHNSTHQKDFARVQEQLGDLIADQGNATGALDHYRKSLGIRTFMSKQDGAPSDSSQDAIRLNNKISKLQRRLGDAEAALQTQYATHALYQKRIQQDPDNQIFAFDLASSHAQIGELLIKLNQADEGLRELKKALPLFEQVAERFPDDLRYARAPGAIHNRMGDLLHARDDLSGALHRYQTALGIAERLALQHPKDPEISRDLAICHENLGDTLTGLDDTQEADQHYKKFLDIAECADNRKAFGGKRAREIAAVHIKLGRSRESEKMHRLAVERYIQARAMIEKLAIDFPENHRLREDLLWLRQKISRLTERLEADDRRIARNRAKIPDTLNPETTSDWQGDL